MSSCEKINVNFICKTIIFSLLIIFFFMSGCRKAVEKVDLKFIGYWNSYDLCKARFDIQQPDFENMYIDECEAHIHGGKVRIGNEKLSMKGKYHFEILEWPVEVDTTIFIYDYYTSLSIDTIKSHWRMQLKKPSCLGGQHLVFYKTEKF